MKAKTKYSILLTIFLISLASSLILSLTPISLVCDPGKGCDVVQHSPYSYFLGIKNSHYGVIAFSILSLITFFQLRNPSSKKRLYIDLGILIGSGIAIYFIYLQEFVIKAYCKYCLIIDIGLIFALFLMIFTFRKN